MDAKYYPLLAGILVLIVVGFLLWQKSLVATKNSTGLEAELPNVEDATQSQNKNMDNIQNKQGELKIEVQEEGAGEEAKNGDLVFVHYTGYLENGQVFDSSIGRGEPISFVLGTGQVIQGWDQGILGMKKGEKRKLTIPPQLAYGEAGAGGVIPPNATLIFEVEMVDVKAE